MRTCKSDYNLYLQFALYWKIDKVLYPPIFIFIILSLPLCMCALVPLHFHLANLNEDDVIIRSLFKVQQAQILDHTRLFVQFTSTSCIIIWAKFWWDRHYCPKGIASLSFGRWFVCSFVRSFVCNSFMTMDWNQSKAISNFHRHKTRQSR